MMNTERRDSTQTAAAASASVVSSASSTTDDVQQDSLAMTASVRRTSIRAIQQGLKV